MDITRFDPRDEFSRLRGEIARIFDNPFRIWSLGREFGHPSVDVYETNDHVVIKAELPGVSPGDLDVRVMEDRVTLKGEVTREEEREERGYYHRERRHGSFYRTIPLPVPVQPNETTASFKHGVLEVKALKAKNLRDEGYRVRIDEGSH